MTNVCITIQISCVLNNLLSIIEIHINVKIGHGNTFRIQKSFKNQTKPKWVNICDCHGIGNKRTSSRTASRSNRNVMFRTFVNRVVSRFCPVDEFPNYQKVTGKPHGKNCVHFIVSSCSDFWCDFLVSFF